MNSKQEKEVQIWEAYARVWQAQDKALENMPVPEVDLKKLKKWHRRSPRRRLLRREVATLVASVALLVFFLCEYKKGMSMPVPCIITLLLCVLGMADSLYALRLIVLTNPLTSTIPDMLTNCAKLRLYQKIELIAALVVILPLSVCFAAPVSVWIFYSMNIYSDGITDTFSWTILLTAVLSGVFVSIYMYRSNLQAIKDIYIANFSKKKKMT